MNLNNEIKDNNLRSFKKVIEVNHYTDGRVQIFNLLSESVFISEINYKNEKIKVNKFTEPSRKNYLSKIEITTNLKGI